MIDDVEAVERAERDLDTFINRRSASRDNANAREEMWRTSERRHEEKHRLELREEWREYERHLEAIHMSLALEHRAKADALDESQPKPP